MYRQHRFRSILCGIIAAFAVTAPAQILVSGPELLDQKTVNVLIEANEVLMELKFNASQRQRFQTEIVKQWRTGNSQLIQDTKGLKEAFPQWMALPKRTRDLAMRANLIGFLTRLEQDAANGDEISKIMQEAYRQNHPAIDPAAPLFSKIVADAFVNAYLFLGELQSGRPAPALSEKSRHALRVQIAKDYSRAGKAQREQISNVVGKVTSFMIHWPQMADYEKLLARAEVGAKLTMQEQQVVQQVRHQLNNHNLTMMTRELNFMKQSQQTIMGSAPYWNPAANRWEQKGGIVTEFN